MDKLEIEGSFKNPTVLFDGKEGNLSIEGKSIPERTDEFYRPLLDWLDEYFAEDNPVTTLNLNLEYCNSASTRYILDILEKVEASFKKGNKVAVNWYYEEDDEDMQYLGQSYQESLELEIELIPIVDKG